VKDKSGVKPRCFGDIIVFSYVLYGTYIAARGAHSHGYRDSEAKYLGLEDYSMHHLKLYLSALLLAGAIFAPSAIMASPKPQEARVQVRVYDRNHRDYHNWDDHEDRAYRGYLEERHRSYREYDRQNNREQKHYWNWRHSHPDRDHDRDNEGR
jgi:hypothetical protein